MLKKIFLTLTILFSILFSINSYLFAEGSTSSSGGNPGCTGTSCLTSEKFTINVASLSPGKGSLYGSTAELTFTQTLLKIIELMMVAIGVIALFIMTIGGGFMIAYAGQDELLTKGKSMFTGGLIAVTVALLSGVMVKLLAYILYS